MKTVSLSEIKESFNKYLQLAGKQKVVITRNGKPVGALIGFASDDDWVDYQLENDSRFLKRIERARKSIRNGRGVRLENLPVK